MTEGQDYVIYDSGLFMTYRAPMKNTDVCVVGTKNYLFFVPKQSTGIYLVVRTVTTHQYFENASIPEGTRKIIAEAENVEALESAMIALLENDEKYVYKIEDQSSFKFRGFLGKHTLRMSPGGAKWASIMANGKGKSKEMRTFYGQ